MFLLLHATLAFSKQRDNPLSINASYLSLNLRADATHKGQYWQTMHKMPAGNFICRSVSKGTLQVSYDSDSKPAIYQKMDIASGDQVASFTPSINGFNLYGVYTDPSLPFDMVQVFYVHPKKKNSVLILVHSLYTEEVFAATYFSNTADNPFEKIGLLQGAGKSRHIRLR